MNNEPKIHHYIPQFILRNFTDENKQLTYWSIKDKKLSKRNPKSVFMNEIMYRDESLDNPVQIENDFSLFEKEYSDIIHNKVLNTNKIILTRKEVEIIRIFLSLMSFRSNLRMKQYKEKLFDDSSRRLLQQFQLNENYEQLGKRELNILTKCRSYDEINSSKDIDPIIKQEFMNDIQGQYMTFVEARGGDFLISDLYPTLEIFPLQNNINIHLHHFYPLSSNRMLVLNHIMFRPEKEDLNYELKTMKSFSKISGNLIEIPKTKYKLPGMIYSKDDVFIYNVKKIYKEDVEYINSLFLNEANVGLAFKDSSRIIESIRSFNGLDNTKQKYEDLESKIK